MTVEAERILAVFRSSGVSAGGMIHPAEFGEAIVWEKGSVRGEAVRVALAYLFQEGYLVEHPNAIELTEKGASVLMESPQPKHGARVYGLGGTVLIKQTVLRGTPAEYVIDEQRERHVRVDDDVAIAHAIRAAINGQL